MTIFRFKLIAAVAVLPLSAQVSAQFTRSQWTMVYADSEEVHKLLYVPAGEVDGDVYMRCRTGEGWILVQHDVPEERSLAYRPLLRAGSFTDKPSYSMHYEKFEELFYFEAAVPADSRLFDQMAAGAALVVDGVTYPVTTATEQKTIRNFAKVCASEVE